MRRGRSRVLSWLLVAPMITTWSAGPARAQCAPGLDQGPLQIHPDNPRYLTDGVTLAPDGSCKAILLAGGHTWAIFQDYLAGDGFSTNDYLDGIEALGQNFTRGWMWEDDQYENPPPEKLGSGLFDLDVTSQAYLDNLVDKVGRADQRGLYVSVMLFEGWSLKTQGSNRCDAPWPDDHPYALGNNVNGIDGDDDNSGDGDELHSIHPDPRVWEDHQKPYIHAVIDTLAASGYDNYFFEVTNESPFESWDWQYQIMQEIEDYETSKGYEHRLRWMSCSKGGHGSEDENAFLDDPDNPADLVAPCFINGRYDSGADANPNAVSGQEGAKARIYDSDHLGPVQAQDAFVWASVTRGYHPAFMDLSTDLEWWDHGPNNDCNPMDNRDWELDDTEWPQIRAALGIAVAVTDLVDLHRMAPQGRSVTTPADSTFGLFTTSDPTAASPQPDGEQFLAFNADPDSTALTICDMDDGLPYTLQRFHRWNGSSTGPTEVFATGGCFTVSTPWTDKSVVVLKRDAANDPPVALFRTVPPAANGELYIPVGTTVDFFDDGSFDPDGGDVLEWNWDLDGDGAFDDASGVSASWLYGTVGSFPGVNLQVIDDEMMPGVGDAITVHVGEPPTVTADPASQAISIGDDVTFSVTATGTAPLTYRWQKDGADLGDGGDVSGATTDTLSIATVEAADAGAYRCVVANDFGSDTSAEAQLYALVGDLLVQDHFNGGGALDGHVPDVGSFVWDADNSLLLGAGDEVVISTTGLDGDGGIPLDPLGMVMRLAADLDPGDSTWAAVGFSTSAQAPLGVDGQLYVLLGVHPGTGQPRYRVRVPNPAGGNFNLALGVIPGFVPGALNRVDLRYDPATTATLVWINGGFVYGGNVFDETGVVPDTSFVVLELADGVVDSSRIDNLEIRLGTGLSGGG